MKKLQIGSVKLFDIFRNSKFEIRNSRSARGFALIELIIAAVLFGFITTFILVAYNRVGGQLFLTSFAYELALAFREAQSYGVSVREFRAAGSAGTFDVGYGLHFDSGSSNTYAFFADKEVDGAFLGAHGGAYDDTGCLITTECISVSKIQKGNVISKFCGVLPTGDSGRDAPDGQKNEECSTNSLPASNPTIDYLDVTFLRPNPDAIIKTSRTAEAGQQYKAARIYVASPSGEKRVIEVVNTGQISIGRVPN